jgi:hypothetical protein
VESEEVAILRLLSDIEYDVDDLGIGTVGAVCLGQPLQNGDSVTSAEDPAGVTHSVRARVMEIHFYQQLESREPAYSANIVLSGDLGLIGKGWSVRAVRPRNR